MRECIDSWLRDAHAMERESSAFLGARLGRIVHYPSLHDLLEAHLHETNCQVERLEDFIAQRSRDAGPWKHLRARLQGEARSASLSLCGDEVIETVIALVTQKQMEIASYQILAAAAEEASDEEVAELCQTLCQQEHMLVSRVQQQVPELIHLYLLRERIKGVPSKR